MQKPIYFDYLATTPVDPRVVEKMVHCLSMEGNFGNPASRSHLYGWKAEEAVQTTQAGHQLPRCCRIEEFHIHKSLLQMRVKTLHIVCSSKRRVPLFIFTHGQLRLRQQHMQLITDNLHRHGKV